MSSSAGGTAAVGAIEGIRAVRSRPAPSRSSRTEPYHGIRPAADLLPAARQDDGGENAAVPPRTDFYEKNGVTTLLGQPARPQVDAAAKADRRRSRSGAAVPYDRAVPVHRLAAVRSARWRGWMQGGEQNELHDAGRREAIWTLCWARGTTGACSSWARASSA